MQLNSVSKKSHTYLLYKHDLQIKTGPSTCARFWSQGSRPATSKLNFRMLGVVPYLLMSERIRAFVANSLPSEQSGSETSARTTGTIDSPRHCSRLTKRLSGAIDVNVKELLVEGIPLPGAGGFIKRILLRSIKIPRFKLVTEHCTTK